MDMAQATLCYHRMFGHTSLRIIKSNYLLTDVCSATGRLSTTSRPAKKNQSRHPQLRFQLKFQSLRLQCLRASASTTSPVHEKSGVRFHSLMLLEWDKLCDLVASFASTSLGRQATIAQLWKLDNSYDDSLRLLQETNAALQMRSHGGCRLDFVGLDLLLVESAIQHARRSLNVGGNEAIAIAALLDSAICLQLNLKSAVKEDSNWYSCFLPLSEVITEMVINRSLVKMIQQVIDEDGSIKDSASVALKRSRAQVRMLEDKVFILISIVIFPDLFILFFQEVSSVDGRWCVKSGPGQLTNVKGLLLSRQSGRGSIIEPLSAVPLNDELQQARLSVVQAEADVLSMLTEKIRNDVDDIEKVLESVIQLDVINARATYSHSYGGSCPDLYPPVDLGETVAPCSSLPTKNTSNSITREWLLYMPEASHPLLLQQHKQHLKEAKKDSRNASAASGSEQPPPVPVDFFIEKRTRVLVITGPNTGGKTICLKTVGLAAMMAKSGLHILASESVQIPWFDSVFANIGEEQSLSESLSTFSGRLKQISEIRSESTSQSLVLLDEVGAGTNPLEGAALGMAMLESFANSGALLTLATTHHGELKSLKYSNDAFENASMEFDEENLKPTYKILWGVPGRSNAINISEKLGLPSTIVSDARELIGASNEEINEVIIGMERSKQDFRDHLIEAEQHLGLSRNIHKNLLRAKRRIMDHAASQRYRKAREISEAVSLARSVIRKKVRELQARETHPATSDKRQSVASDKQIATTTAADKLHVKNEGLPPGKITKQVPPESMWRLPKVGEMVQVSRLGRKATVLQVDPAREDIVVQAGNMKLKLKLADIRT
ncbi:Endonuclease MutS2 [Linum perenne]